MELIDEQILDIMQKTTQRHENPILDLAYTWLGAEMWARRQQQLMQGKSEDCSTSNKEEHK